MKLVICGPVLICLKGCFLMESCFNSLEVCRLNGEDINPITVMESVGEVWLRSMKFFIVGSKLMTVRKNLLVFFLQT